jgi:hypothetical protein
MTEETEMDTFFKNKEDPDEPLAEELSIDEMSQMKLKVPRPLYDKLTKCKIREAKFFKNDAPEKDAKQNSYIPFFVTIEFQEIARPEIVFKETYRGGRIYTNKDQQKLYLGPASALGKIKIACIENGLPIGNSIKEWGEAMVGKTVSLKADTVMYGGKKYEKNYILSIEK